MVPLFDIEPDLWLVDCDEDQVNQMLQNLVLNAKQAQPSDNAIRISARNAVSEPGGSGLGLTSVHSIIRKHGGHVDVVSRAGVGTTFTVYLPASAAQAAPEAARQPVVSAPSAKLTGRVLVMDDQKNVRMVASLRLQELGLEVDLAEHGEAAISAYEAQRQAGRRHDRLSCAAPTPAGTAGSAS